MIAWAIMGAGAIVGYFLVVLDPAALYALMPSGLGYDTGQIDALYETAIKDPSFAGERSAYGQTLDELRVLREESQGLHAKLDAGKTREQTLHSWERIKELTRDLRESASWEFVPTDLAASAKAALGSTQQLDGFYGAY